MSFARSQGKCWAAGLGTLCSDLLDWRPESPSTEGDTDKEIRETPSYKDLTLKLFFLIHFMTAC